MGSTYEAALEGLNIDDPVKAFFDWCMERESIRKKRERGESPPWTEDPIFRKGRFLNTFREDDKGSEAVKRFCEPVEDSLTELVLALFFARWCNQHTTLDELEPSDLDDPDLKDRLLNEVPQPWYSEAYPVEPVHWEDKTYDRLKACSELFPSIVDFLVDRVKQADGNAKRAIDLINDGFQMSNDFPIFMAVIDISWFRPDVIPPDSPVPVGIGAKPFLDRLKDHLGCEDYEATMEKMIELQDEYWPEARRNFTPVDIEYLCCECRKYYSYVNGTKQFEGRNRFEPGGSDE
ncbi:MAG: nucleotide kinase domain-containing protein [bacterium]